MDRFCTLDDIVTPARIPSAYSLMMVYFYIIFGNTMLHIQREKALISFEVTNKKILLFLRMLLLSGCHKLSDRKM